MRRAFTGEPVDTHLLDELLDSARRVPSAGNSQGLSWLVLAGATETARYWDVAMPSGRKAFGFPGLLAAPVLVLALTDPRAYVTRYGESDKVATGLGANADAWPVPYWFVDAGMAIEALLISAHEAGLGACLFGLFDHERPVLDSLGVPSTIRAVGTIALGHRSDEDPAGRSAGRARRQLDDVIHRGSWRAPPVS